MKILKKIKDCFGIESKDCEVYHNAKPKGNYIENKNQAISIICEELAKYSMSSDKNLAVLKLWIVVPEDNPEVFWADFAFLTELKSNLHQERIDAIKEVVVNTLTLSKIQELTTTDNTILSIIPERLYYSTQPANKHEEIDASKIPPAWLICISGEEHIVEKCFELNPQEKTKWNIGRSEKPSILETNDVVIHDECTDISRQQALISIDDGQYYLDCKAGGCRMKGGRVTKIHRNEGKIEELISTAHKATAHLKEGDVIQLSKSIYLRFSFIQPNVHSVPTPIINIDNSF